MSRGHEERAGGKRRASLLAKRGGTRKASGAPCSFMFHLCSNAGACLFCLMCLAATLVSALLLDQPCRPSLPCALCSLPCPSAVRLQPACVGALRRSCGPCAIRTAACVCQAALLTYRPPPCPPPFACSLPCAFRLQPTCVGALRRSCGPGPVCAASCVCQAAGLTAVQAGGGGGGGGDRGQAKGYRARGQVEF